MKLIHILAWRPIYLFLCMYLYYVDGETLFEGDIKGIDPDFLAVSLQPGIAHNGIRNGYLRWQDGIVPYEISTTFTPDERKQILKAFKGFNATCIRFIERKDDNEFLHFIPGIGCWSFIGRQPQNRSVISLQQSHCLKTGIIQHELMHTLGFLHEQSRTDRDEYVDILWENIENGRQNNNFLKYNDKEITSFGLPYDFDSILHYGKNEFAKKQTLISIEPKPQYRHKQIGQRERLSSIDIKKINIMYKCSSRILQVSAQPTKTTSTPGPLKLQPSQSQRVEEQGCGFVVTCKIADGVKATNLRWTQGRNLLEINSVNEKRISLMKRPSPDKPTSIVLIFDNVTRENEGLYTCLANVDGQDTHKEFHLSVYEGISYDNVKLSQDADIGSDFTMTCNVEGIPKPRVSWRRGVPIPSSGSDKYKVGWDGLRILNVTKADGEGQYDCEATQMVGDFTSHFKRKAITLVVNFPPEFADKEPVTAYSFLGGEINLICQADAEPEAHYDWGYYEGYRWVDIPLSELKKREDFTDPSRTSLIKIMSDISQFREIVCCAKNMLGRAEKKYNVIQVDQPPPPIFQFGKISGHQVQIHVTLPEKQDGPLPTTGYRALIRPKNGGAWENATVINFQNGTVHVLDSLFHNTEYDIILATRNPVGLGQFSELRSIRTSTSGANSKMVR